MQRFKNSSAPPARPNGSLLMGAMIGTAIVTMATQAIALGAGTAIRNTALKGG